MWSLSCRACFAALGVFLGLATASAQEAPRPTQAASEQVAQGGGTIRFRLPTITVTAQKEPENVQDSPVSVTAVTNETLEDAGIQSVSEAAKYAPNTFFNEFTARKLSVPSFRGVGSSSPNNPGVTTYIDGVPQLNTNSSSIELVGVNQIEFVRGPQSALFGRNTLGGLINITSIRPSLSSWTGAVTGPFGNFAAGDVRGTASGPLADTLAISVGAGFSRRNGFTTNDVTGHDLDSRSAAFGKLQLLWTPASNWEVRGIMSGERARDGDYALQDLQALRAKPFHASRDFEGFTHRDIVAPTLLVSRAGKAFDVFSTTGFVWWQTRDLTDLDYTPLPLVRRDNSEKDHQLTQEFRLASAKNMAMLLADGLTLKWQGGVFLFTQSYNQDAVNTYSPYVLAESIPILVAAHSPKSALDDHGVGVFGEGTLTFGGNLDATIGLRADREHKAANLKIFYVPVPIPEVTVDAERDFTDVSPQFTVAYRAVPGKSVYVTAARGFKAGGFNSVSPAGREAYGEEHSWNYEGGVKSWWLGERLSLNGAVFYLNWRDRQVNVSNPSVPAQFYIANAGSATSKGGEIEIDARPAAGLDLFGGLGFTKARFGAGSLSNGTDVGGKKISNTPDYTVNAGIQYSRAMPNVSAASIYGRAEIVSYGAYQYDDANTASQSAYSLANFRGGVRGKLVFLEGWVRNAFDTNYVLTAFPFPSASGFIGESGPARTFGIRAGVTF